MDAFTFLRETDRAFDLIYVAPPQYKELWGEAMRLIAARPDLLRRPSAESGEDPARPGDRPDRSPGVRGP